MQFKVWLENMEEPRPTAERLWQQRMQPTSQDNLLVNRAQTIARIQQIEGNNVQEDPNVRNSIGNVCNKLDKRVAEIMRYWDSIDWNDPEEEEYEQDTIQRTFNPRDSVGVIYGSGGYSRYPVFLNGDVFFDEYYTYSGSEPQKRMQDMKPPFPVRRR